MIDVKYYIWPLVATIVVWLWILAMVLLVPTV